MYVILRLRASRGKVYSKNSRLSMIDLDQNLEVASHVDIDGLSIFKVVP